MGCTTQVWVSVSFVDDDSNKPLSDRRVSLNAFSDSTLTRGLAASLIAALSGITAGELASLNVPDFLSALGYSEKTLQVALASGRRAPNASSILETLRKKANVLIGDIPRFPSLLINSTKLTPQGAFAEAQAAFLSPPTHEAAKLGELLKAKRMGVVAHFYMDPEVQGMLVRARDAVWPHVAISDSLVMADKALQMAKAGCQAVAVLGVDFMSENVRAILDEGGYPEVKVYRMSAADIGCSLAESAESAQYERYLSNASARSRLDYEKEAKNIVNGGDGGHKNNNNKEKGNSNNTAGRAVHVVYINTSLRTKARADALVPTITCTSSNVVSTVLQAAAQIPGVRVYYGPDTYMGRNLVHLLQRLADAKDDVAAQALHPQHTRATIRDLLSRIEYYDAGSCVVHHIFGGQTCEYVRKGYSDAFLTAHFEVPGEMFELALEAQGQGRGVVGSTSNILDFIAGRLRDAELQYAADQEEAKKSGRGSDPLKLQQQLQQQPRRLTFVLGTEAGMITSIVNKVQDMLGEAKKKLGLPLDAVDPIDVEIVFPVNSRSITTNSNDNINPDNNNNNNNNSSNSGSVYFSSPPSSVPIQLPTGLQILPGPAGGEGCSSEGGCASCPYMKMNTLDALKSVARKIDSPAGEALLTPFEPRRYHGEKIQGKSLAAAGCVSILHMRDFQKLGRFSDRLVNDIIDRPSKSRQ
nr:quinolinate synthase chloroplastic (QS) [Polytomella parva]|eukprot:CAMPEP_0175059686 /NCGR_PEP_ID=MMETSP0052_2-20121109/12572_1 /TAXON_ID=51329 ORGANISM="Polytomella parva, Strain SAG 63-3" /NCGR_SAMPLE_ID=MMETSP0052_2 /ASSEMBLY_ACC=CAM_ASM_000194 /LENGTH=696 /DNA_ID=CAMNT_0016325267 /DNA_START=353 /DNA_END=2443 /DNA_ORIENTATION=+